MRPPDSRPSRTPAFASTAFVFEIASNDQAVVEVAIAVFGDLVSHPDTMSRQPLATATIDVADSAVMVDLFDGCWRQVDSIADALWAVAREVNRLSLASDEGRMHLHAAALARGGAAALVLGKRRTGKSTLSAHLLQSGWCYLSDEMVAIDSDSPQISTYPKPVALRSGTLDLLPTLADHGLPIRQHGAGRLVRASALGRVSADDHPVGLIVLLQPGPGSVDSLELSIAHPIDALVEVMRDHVMDAERAGLGGVLSLGRLLAAATAIRLRSGALESVEKALEIHLSGPRRPGALQWRAASTTGRTAGVSMLEIDGASLLIDSSMQFVALDAEHTRDWVRFCDGGADERTERLLVELEQKGLRTG